MKIMLASILERTREIASSALGRAEGYHSPVFDRSDADLLFVGPVGIGFGFGISRLIALLAGWSTSSLPRQLSRRFLFQSPWVWSSASIR
jgi:hypothetical protein